MELKLISKCILFEQRTKNKPKKKTSLIELFLNLVNKNLITKIIVK